MSALRMELTLCHPSGTRNFEAALEVLENLWNSALGTYILVRSLCKAIESSSVTAHFCHSSSNCSFKRFRSAV